MLLCLSTLQEEMRLVNFDEDLILNQRSTVESFLDEIAESVPVPSKRKEVLKPDRSLLVSDANRHRFYCGTSSPWLMANSIYDALVDWSEKTGGEKDDERITLDEEKLRRICWKYYLMKKKAAVTKEDWLSPECTYRLFLLYNKLLLRDDTTDLEVGQVNTFLMKLVMLAQYTWSPPLEYKTEGSEFVNFPEFVTVVTEYFSNLHLNTDFTCELIGELYELMVLGILKKGFLVKQGHVRKNWNRRYFILQLTTLTYYEDKELTKKKGGMVLNRNTKLLNVRDVNFPSHPRKFIVICGESEVDYHICAEDQRTKQSWLLAIQKAIALAKILNPQTQQELLSSLSEWKQVVYGDSPGNVRETIGHHSPLRTTLALQQVISEAITVSLKRNRQEDVFGRMSPSRSPGYDKIILSGSPHAIRKLCQGNYPLFETNSPRKSVSASMLSEDNSSMFDTSSGVEDTQSERRLEKLKQRMYNLKLVEQKNSGGISQFGGRDQVVTDEVIRLKQDLATQQLENKQLGCRVEHLTTQLHQQQEELTTQLEMQHEELTRHFEQKLTDQLAEQRRAIQEEMLQQFQTLQPSWSIAQHHLQMTPHVLGRGAWGEVRVGTYQGTRVAVKKMHDVIISDHNRELFEREMIITSRVRHPHLVLFIGAVTTGNLTIVSELMETSLRKVMEEKKLKVSNLHFISKDVACALAYLHSLPDPVVHRDVSSANVLLYAKQDGWCAKLSDFGSANFLAKLGTVAPGAVIYSAPEAVHPRQQGPKMDVYSFGILLFEMCVGKLIDQHTLQTTKTAVANWTDWEKQFLGEFALMCTETNPDKRPNMADFVEYI